MGRVEVGEGEHLADPARNDRDLQDVGVHRCDCEEPDEAVLEDAAVGVLADGEDIRVRAEAQVAGDVCLRQRQQFGVLGQARAGTLAPAQHTEAGSRCVTRHASVVHRAALVAQQREMPIG